ncbi:conserved hypothetical protein [Microcystis aeruginosa PCC 9807]|uniref:Uncharacterized protein n=1 Tax=Microcystis aeruginosa PCC 9807 TaxID=1160283 RepID=I4H3V3_MICAE|nr:hypothetical protein [Microcystis aeruginosa]CCI16727.1 conserved hypothetical protein [Microcystis aeruginosa PCC 9807]
MFGSRQLMLSIEQAHNAERDHQKNVNRSGEYKGYLRHLCQQAKQVSQIIAYIWRWGDEDETDEYSLKHKQNALDLKSYFEEPTSEIEKPGENLLRLFKANPKNADDKTKEANLLRAVFFIDKRGKSTLGFDNEQYEFPIFDIFAIDQQEDTGGYIIEIVTDSFQGKIGDSNANHPSFLTLSIPYPPRPQFGKLTLDKETLDNWIRNRKEGEYYAKNIYIPTTTC